MMYTMKINKTVTCDGSSLWGNTKGRPVTVKSIDFEDDNGYFLAWVNHNRRWTIYTDEGFEKALSKILSQKVGKTVKVEFTEQGMQEDGRASMQFRFKTCETNFRKFLRKKSK